MVFIKVNLGGCSYPSLRHWQVFSSVRFWINWGKDRNYLGCNCDRITFFYQRASWVEGEMTFRNRMIYNAVLILMAWTAFMLVESIHDAITFMNQGKMYYFPNVDMGIYGDVWHFCKYLMYPLLFSIGYMAKNFIVCWEQRAIALFTLGLILYRFIFFDLFLSLWRISG